MHGISVPILCQAQVNFRPQSHAFYPTGRDEERRKLQLAYGMFPSWTAFGNVPRLFDRSNYKTTAEVYLEAILKTDDGDYPAVAHIYNVSDGREVAASVAQTKETGATRVRSAAITFPSGSKEYRVDFGGRVGATYTIYSADLIVAG